MRRLFFVIVLLSFIITACTSVTPTERPSIIVERPAGTPVRKTPVPARPSATPVPETPTPEQAPVGPADGAVVKQLAANLAYRKAIFLSCAARKWSSEIPAWTWPWKICSVLR
jgi:hypothetical protein